MPESTNPAPALPLTDLIAQTAALLADAENRYRYDGTGRAMETMRLLAYLRADFERLVKQYEYYVSSGLYSDGIEERIRRVHAALTTGEGR